MLHVRQIDVLDHKAHTLLQADFSTRSHTQICSTVDADKAVSLAKQSTGVERKWKIAAPRSSCYSVTENLPRGEVWDMHCGSSSPARTSSLDKFWPHLGLRPSSSPQLSCHSTPL